MSPLVRIQGTMTAQRYLDNVLRPVAFRYHQGLPNAIFQQDNAHTVLAQLFEVEVVLFKATPTGFFNSFILSPLLAFEYSFSL